MRRRAFLAGGIALAAAPVETGAAATQLQFGGSLATLDIEGAASDDFYALVKRWVLQSAGVVEHYYGRFPVPEVYINVVTGGGARVRGGQTFPGEVPLIRMRVGGDSSEDTLMRKDWVMVHEMVHLAFPWMNLNHNWMAEGLAVYVESIARLQAGQLTQSQVWGDFIHMMPRGLPQPGDGGYDVTVSWGRTYWGGAIFCLMADLEIRRETGNTIGLQHALRAINRERDFRREWDFPGTLAIGDKATGTTVLTRQYQAMRIEPVAPDLKVLWRELGVNGDGGTIAFDDDAPLAAIRRAIETAA